MSETGLITGIDALCVYLNCSPPTARKYLASGMPGEFVKTGDGGGGRWHFHKQNIERYFIELTARQRRADADKLIDSDDEPAAVKPAKKKQCQGKKP